MWKRPQQQSALLIVWFAVRERQPRSSGRARKSACPDAVDARYNGHITGHTKLVTEERMSSLMDTPTFSTEASEVARRPLQADQCALIVIDIQEKLLPPIVNKDALIKNSQLLIRLAKILSIPAVVTVQYSRGLGTTVPEIASLLDDVKAIDKLEFGCFGSDLFRAAVKSLPGNRNTMLLCGMESHICVTQTALGALNDGYLVDRKSTR